MFCCLTASTARALLRMAYAEFGIYRELNLESVPLRVCVFSLTFSQRHANGLVLCFPSVANAALAS